MCRAIKISDVDSLMLTRDPYTGSEVAQLVSGPAASQGVFSSYQGSYASGTTELDEGPYRNASCDRGGLRRQSEERRRASRAARNRGERAEEPADFFGVYTPIRPAETPNVCSRDYIANQLSRSFRETISYRLETPDHKVTPLLPKYRTITATPYSIQMANYLGTDLNYQMLCPADNLSCEPSVYNLHNAGISVGPNEAGNGFNIGIQGNTQRCNISNPIATADFYSLPCMPQSVTGGSVNRCDVINSTNRYIDQERDCSSRQLRENFEVPNENIYNANFTDIAVSCEAPDCKAYVVQNQPRDFRDWRQNEHYTQNNNSSAITGNHVLIVRNNPRTNRVTNELILNGRSVQVYNGQERDNLAEYFDKTSCAAALNSNPVRDGLGVISNPNDLGRLNTCP